VYFFLKTSKIVHKLIGHPVATLEVAENENPVAAALPNTIAIDIEGKSLIAKYLTNTVNSFLHKSSLILMMSV